MREEGRSERGEVAGAGDGVHVQHRGGGGGRGHEGGGHLRDLPVPALRLAVRGRGVRQFYNAGCLSELQRTGVWVSRRT